MAWDTGTGTKPFMTLILYYRLFSLFVVVAVIFACAVYGIVANVFFIAVVGVVAVILAIAATVLAITRVIAIGSVVAVVCAVTSLLGSAIVFFGIVVFVFEIH